MILVVMFRGSRMSYIACRQRLGSRHGAVGGMIAYLCRLQAEQILFIREQIQISTGTGTYAGCNIVC